MARRPRLYCPDTIQHLVSRGVRRQDIFESRGQYSDFLGDLVSAANGGELILLGFCLMPNHWHLLIKQAAAALGEVLQPILTRFAARSNKLNGRSGHVFQGRFKSFLLDSTEKAQHVLRYIHRNPLRAKLVEDPGDWRWSSHAEYAGAADSKTIQTELLLGAFHQKPERARALYRDFMRQETPPGVRPDLLPVIERICSQVEVQEGLPSGTLRGPSGAERVIKARHRAIRLASQAGADPKSLAAYLGISRSTVFYAKRG